MQNNTDTENLRRLLRSTEVEDVIIGLRLCNVDGEFTEEQLQSLLHRLPYFTVYRVSQGSCKAGLIKLCRLLDIAPVIAQRSIKQDIKKHSQAVYFA